MSVRRVPSHMHVSRAVQTIRDDPIEGESIALVLETADEADADDVAEAAEDAGATVERRLQFEDLVVETAQERVGDVCDLDGVAAIQTADAIGIHPDEAEESEVLSTSKQSSGPGTGPRDDLDPEALGDG